MKTTNSKANTFNKSVSPVKCCHEWNGFKGGTRFVKELFHLLGISLQQDLHFHDKKFHELELC